MTVGKAVEKMESISGVLWKCKYGIAGSVYWKKKFTYLDSEKLLHWQTEKRPTESDKTPPRHGFLLHRCEITEEPKLRPCAFKITDKLDNRSMIFACNNVAEYDKWMKILSMEHKDPATKDDPSVDESGTLEDEHGFDFDFNFDNDNQSLETADDFNIRTTDGTLPHMQSFKAAAPSFVDAKSALAASAMFSASILIPGKPTVAPKVTVADIAKAFFQRSDGQVRKLIELSLLNMIVENITGGSSAFHKSTRAGETSRRVEAWSQPISHGKTHFCFSQYQQR